MSYNSTQFQPDDLGRSRKYPPINPPPLSPPPPSEFLTPSPRNASPPYVDANHNDCSYFSPKQPRPHILSKEPRHLHADLRIRHRPEKCSTMFHQTPDLAIRFCPAIAPLSPNYPILDCCSPQSRSPQHVRPQSHPKHRHSRDKISEAWDLLQQRPHNYNRRWTCPTSDDSLELLSTISPIRFLPFPIEAPSQAA